MKNEKMDGILKAYFSRQKEVPQKSADCPSVEALGKYVLGELGPNELYDISMHTKSCKFCNELIEGALLYSAYGKQINVGDVPLKIKEKAKSLNPTYKKERHKIMDYLKRGVWLMLCLVSLLMSFFIPRYFLQFLILSVIFGLKWVFNRESTRALIMIYNAWKKHDKIGDKEIEEIFKSRF